MNDVQVIIEQVRSATVVIATGPPENGLPKGSGFFVAPGRIVTCAHVVEETGAVPHIWWHGSHFPATLLFSTPHPVPGAARDEDVAILAVECTNHACVPLAAEGSAQVNDEVWAYGVSQVRAGLERRPERDASVLKIQALPYAQNQLPSRFLNLGGRISKGMSGGPLLNLEPGRMGVCGVVQARKTAGAAELGYAVAIEDVLKLAPAEDLREANPSSLNTLENIRAAQLGFKSLPKFVGALLDGAAVTVLTQYFEDRFKRMPPLGIDEAGRVEWVARQLFTLSLSQFYGSLVQLVEITGIEKAGKLFKLVAPCLLVSRREPWWWISSDAAESLFAELDSDHPRLVYLATERRETIDCVLRRAFPWAFEVRAIGGGTSGEAREDEIPAETSDDFFADMKEKLGMRGDEKLTFDSDAIQELRDQNVVVKIDLGPSPDLDLVQGIREKFDGMSIILCRKSFVPPAGADDHLLVLKPAFVPDNEKKALDALSNLQAIK